MKIYPPDVMEIVVKEMHEEKYIKQYFINNLFINLNFIQCEKSKEGRRGDEEADGTQKSRPGTETKFE